MFTFNYAFSRSRLFFWWESYKLSSKKSEESKQETVKKESEEERSRFPEKYEEIEKKMKGIKKCRSLDKLDPLMTEKSFTNSKGIQDGRVQRING